MQCNEKEDTYRHLEVAKRSEMGIAVPLEGDEWVRLMGFGVLIFRGFRFYNCHGGGRTS